MHLVTLQRSHQSHPTKQSHSKQKCTRVCAHTHTHTQYTHTPHKRILHPTHISQKTYIYIPQTCTHIYPKDIHTRCSVAKSCPTLCDPMDCSMPGSLSFTISQSLLKLMSKIKSVMLSNHLILCNSLLLPLIFPSIRVSFNELTLHIRWPKYCLSISPSNEYSGLISFRIDWSDLPAVQGTLKSLLQHHSLKASILQCSAFFMVQLSHPYMTTGNIIAFLFNMLSSFVIAFLPRNKHLLISLLQSPSAVIWEPKKIKSVTAFHFRPFYLP